MYRRHSPHYRTTTYKVQRRTSNEAITGQGESLSRKGAFRKFRTVRAHKRPRAKKWTRDVLLCTVTRPFLCPKPLLHPGSPQISMSQEKKVEERIEYASFEKMGGKSICPVVSYRGINSPPSTMALLSLQKGAVGCVCLCLFISLLTTSKGRYANALSP